MKKKARLWVEKMDSFVSQCICRSVSEHNEICSEFELGSSVSLTGSVTVTRATRTIRYSYCHRYSLYGSSVLRSLLSERKEKKREKRRKEKKQIQGSSLLRMRMHQYVIIQRVIQIPDRFHLHNVSIEQNRPRV